MNGLRQSQFLQYPRAPGMAAIASKMKQGEFCGTLLKALDDLRRIGRFGGPQEQVEVLRHQHPAEEAEILLPTQIPEGLDEVTAKTLGVKQSGTAVGAGGKKMRVIQPIKVALARHVAILQRRVAHIATAAMYAPPASSASSRLNGGCAVRGVKGLR